MGTKIYIRTIPRDTASKISEFRNINSRGATGRKMNKTKISEKCKDGLQALFSSKVGGLKTGLYKKTTDEDGKEITLQEWAEDNWGLAPGFLTNRPIRRGDSFRPEDMTYFQKKSWKLNDGTTVLDLDKLDDWCFYQVCMESKFVANSEKEWKQHKWPKSTHYIALENESEELKYKKAYKRSSAMAKLHDEEFTLPWKRKFVVLLGLSSSRGVLTEEQVNNLLYDMIMEDKSLSSGISHIEEFERMFKALKSPDKRERLEREYLLAELEDYYVVVEKAGTYKWKSQGLEIGFTKSEAIDYLCHPKKQGKIEELEKELKLKKGELV
jgi:hypothetical protein